MEGANILGLVAELAIGLLGFSGIVIAIGGRVSTLSIADRTRFFTMVIYGALVVVLALLPFMLHHAGIVPPALWGWSSVVGAASMLFFMRSIYASNPIYTARVIWADPTVSKAAVVFGYVSLWGSLAVLVLNAADLVFGRSFAPYLLAVLMMFGNALLSFVRLLNAAVRSATGEREGAE